MRLTTVSQHDTVEPRGIPWRKAYASVARRLGAADYPVAGTRTTQRNPMCPVEVSTVSP
jgi:hypothetical protein